MFLAFKPMSKNNFRCFDLESSFCRREQIRKSLERTPFKLILLGMIIHRPLRRNIFRKISKISTLRMFEDVGGKLVESEVTWAS